MGIKIEINGGYEAIGQLVLTLNEKAVKKAVAKSIQRAVKSTLVFAAREFRVRYALPMGSKSSKGGMGKTAPGLKSLLSVTFPKYVKSKTIGSMQGTLSFSTKPISMIHFVKGDKSPTAMKGIPVKSRKPVIVKFPGGKTNKLAKAFIAKAKAGSVQVFRRNLRNRLVKQAVPSLRTYFDTNKPMQERINAFAMQKYKQEFKANLNYYLTQVSMPRVKK